MTSSILDARVGEVTERIRLRSKGSRGRYLDMIASAAAMQPARSRLGCANLAHGFAGCAADDKARLSAGQTPNLGIVTAYNDMLSAHQPYETYPALIRETARALGATAQVAGGVPAMCDGVTQGEAGMELSLFSRDVIALATGVALSHQMFDAAVCLGICDKIVPGLIIGALAFGHLPMVFIPAGPMTSGLPNDQKAKVRQLAVEGKVGRIQLLEAESASYHSPGTCTFYGTANSNQMLMEIMGLHLPGASFVNPGAPERDALTRLAVRRALSLPGDGRAAAAGGPGATASSVIADAPCPPIGQMLDERAFVNGVVGLHATGGSTNLTIHLIAMAAAAGIQLTWQDFSDLADVVPLLCRIYPNGKADVNHFQQAGGMPFLIRELLSAGLLHEDVDTICGPGLARYANAPAPAGDGSLTWQPVAAASQDRDVLRAATEPFQTTGGLRVLSGSIGTAVIKVSAVAPERHVIEAPARVFHSQEGLQQAFKAGELSGDVVAVVRFQGPKANGMPELHKLMPPLGVLQDRGLRVALVTDGRLSGASGKVPAAIHVTPEAVDGGAIARIHDGDLIRVDAVAGTLDVLVDPAVFAARAPAQADLASSHIGVGRNLFAGFRALVGRAEAGASIFGAVDA